MAEETPAPKPARPGASITRNLMFMMLFLTLFVFITPGLQEDLASAIGVVFGPLFGFGGAYPLVTLFLAGTFVTLISSLSRHLFTDWVRATHVNLKSRALQKAQMDALRKGNPAKVSKLRELQSRHRMESADVMTAQLKPLAFTFLPFIVFWWWLNSFIVNEVIGLGHGYIAVPWGFQTSLLAVWFILYLVFTFFLGQVFTRLFKLLSFRRRLGALEAQGGAG